MCYWHFFKNNFHDIKNHFLQVMKLYRIFLGRGIQKILMFPSRGEWEKLLNGRLRVMKKVLMNPNVSSCSPTFIVHICQICKLNIILYWLTLLHTCISIPPIPYFICSAIIACTLYYLLSDDVFCCTVFLDAEGEDSIAWWSWGLTSIFLLCFVYTTASILIVWYKFVVQDPIIEIILSDIYLTVCLPWCLV